MRKIAFLGPNPKNMGGFKLNELQKSIRKYIDEFIRDNECIVITSLQQGVETWAAESAHKYKRTYEVYLPFANQHKVWPNWIQDQYKTLLKNASKKEKLDDGNFSPKKLNEKDKKLIELADEVYSFYPLKGKINQWAEDTQVVMALSNVEEDDYFIDV